MAAKKELKILLVEDSAIMRKMEVKILQDLGFELIVEAGDGEEALAHLRQDRQIGLIISDWNMPGMNGLELLTKVRGQKVGKALPFIMATGEGDKKETARAAAAGVTAMVAKPFTPEELNKAIEGALAGEAAPAAAADIPAWQPRLFGDRLGLRIAHIQITDHLTLGVAKHLLETGAATARHFQLETVCMPGWNPVQAALEKGEIDGAFILAPIAMDLFGYGVPLKVILLAHKNGSICVRKKGGWHGSVADFYRGKTFYIPHKMSIHHMLAHQFFSEAGLRPGVAGKEGADVFLEVAPPVKMPEFLANNPQAAGFMVAEPIGTKAIAAGLAELQFLSGQVWPDHPCCVLAVREEIARDHGEAALELTRLLVQAGQLITEKPNQAAEIGVPFLDPQKTLGLKVPVLKNVLTEEQGIRTEDLLPVAADFERIQQYIVGEMGYGSLIDVKKFVDTGFAEVACKDAAFAQKRKGVGAAAAGQPAMSAQAKAMLEKEGKYLTFCLDTVDYGVNIMKIKEIIGMLPITAVPQMPAHVRGVINLRGKVVPVVDLRQKFGLQKQDYHERTCIIVLERNGAGGVDLTGVVVDAVSEVLNIKADQIEERPYLGGGQNLEFIFGMAKLGGGVKILLDMDQALSSQDIRLPAQLPVQ